MKLPEFIVKNAFLVFNWGVAFSVSTGYALLSYGKEHDGLAMITSFGTNLPMSVVFGEDFKNFVVKINERPLTIVFGLMFGTLPGIAGLAVGWDGAEKIWTNAVFDSYLAAAMFVYMWFTRGVGVVTIWELFQDTFFIPLHLKKSDFLHTRKLLEKVILDYPQLRFILREHLQGAEKLSFAAVHELIEKLHARVIYNTVQKCYIVYRCVVRVISVILALGALLTIPLWFSLGEHGWSHLAPSLPHDTLTYLFLLDGTMSSNLMFYIMSAFRFLDIFFDGFLLLMSDRCHDRTEPYSPVNIMRLMLPLFVTALLTFIGLKSGMGMRNEAKGIELGILTFLSGIYGPLMQVYAGVFANIGAFARFLVRFVPTLPLLKRPRECCEQHLLPVVGTPRTDLEEPLVSGCVLSKHELLVLVGKMEESDFTSHERQELQTLLAGDEVQWMSLFSPRGPASPRRPPRANSGEFQNVLEYAL